MQYLKSQPIWVLWKLSDGRKRPFSALTSHETGASQDHRHEWTDYEKAASALAKAELKIQAAKAAKAAQATTKLTPARKLPQLCLNRPRPPQIQSPT